MNQPTQPTNPPANGPSHPTIARPAPAALVYQGPNRTGGATDAHDISCGSDPSAADFRTAAVMVKMGPSSQ